VSDSAPDAKAWSDEPLERDSLAVHTLEKEDYFQLADNPLRIPPLASHDLVFMPS
jgi:hypothetical protein